MSNDIHTVVAYGVGIEQYETGRVQWAPSWSNAQRRGTISLPASLPIAKALTPPRSSLRAFTARFVGPSMNGLPRKPGCARPRCPRDHLTQADRHIRTNGSRELCPLCRTAPSVGHRIRNGSRSYMLLPFRRQCARSHWLQPRQPWLSRPSSRRRAR